MRAGTRAAVVLALSFVVSACQLIVGLEERKLGPAGGVAGTSGSAGDTGTAGTTGAAGTDGNPGTAGVIGTAGTTGLAGSSGTNGTAGTSGVGGKAGTTGAGGAAGGAGYGGAGGTAGGAAGTTGRGGATGAAGTTGRGGTTGTAGATGLGGSTGAAGTGGMTCLNCMLQLLQKCQTDGTPASVPLAIKVVNNGTQMISLSDVTIRYWLTTSATTSATPVMDIDYSQVVPKTAITAMFNPGYVEIGFTAAAGSLYALDTTTGTGDLQLRFHLADFSAWDTSMADDHSFQSCTDTAYHPWMKTTVYVGGQLVWGTDPVPTALSATDR